MKKAFISSVAGAAFLTSGACAQEAGPGSDAPPIWEGEFFKIYSADGPNGLANEFAVACPDSSRGRDEMIVYLYHVPRATLSDVLADTQKMLATLAESGFTEDYPRNATSGIIGADGSVFPAHKPSQYAQQLAALLAQPDPLPAASVGNPDVLQKIRTFATSFCYGIS